MQHVLRDIAEISSGQGAPQGDSCYCEDGIPFVKAGNMENLVSGGSITAIQKVSRETAKSYKLKLYPKGTVLFAKSGMSCLKGYVYVLPQEAYVVSHLACISPKGDYSDYLRYYFNYQKPNQLVKDEAYPSISLADIGEMEIDIKDINTRASIVSVLDKVEQLIFLRKKQLQKLDDLVKSRFVEMFGDPVRNNHNWQTVSLDEACEGIGDGLHGTPDYDDNGEYPFINGNNLSDGTIQITPSTKMVNQETYKQHYIWLSPNAILLSINGTLGKTAFYHGEKVMLGKSACYCNLKPEIDREFVYSVMRTDAFANYLEENSTKSTIKNVGLKSIRSYRLILPPIELQNQFILFSEQVKKSKLTVEQGLDKLELLKQSLMQKYFG